MIREISIDSLDKVEPLIEFYVKDVLKSDMNVEQFIQQIRDGLSNNKVSLLGLFDDKNDIVGFLLAGLVSNAIRAVYVDSESSVDVLSGEEMLLDAILPIVKEGARFVRAWFPGMSEAFQKLLLTKGFIGYDRAGMSTSLEQILSLKAPLPPGYEFQVYTENMRDEVASLMLAANKGMIDEKVFPELFTTLEDAVNFAKRVEDSTYGEYREPYSKVIAHEGEIVGLCYITIMQQSAGYIPEICTAPEHKRKGLAKAILSYSLQELVKNEPDVTSLRLDVTLANPAKGLYEWAGFEEDRRYTVYNLFC